MRLIWQILLGAVLGVVSAYLVLSLTPDFLWIKNDPWKTSMVAGSEQADPYTRAIVAKNYLYMLNRSEAIYFIADTDGEKKLERNCDYRIEGKDLPARWWSITVYGDDKYLIPNEFGKYSVTSANVVRHNGSWTIYISKNPKGENWIPLRGDGGFYITLRLYNPDLTVYENLERLELPKIILEGCR